MNSRVSGVPVEQPRLVLASSSPRRRELLEMLELDFELRAPEVDETPLPGEQADRYVERLAREKSQREVRPRECVLAADTSVVLDGTILGKPSDEHEAASMLRRLSGRSHQVLTGVAVTSRAGEGTPRVISKLCCSTVSFRSLSDDDVQWYLATGEGRDKAGAYGVQGIGGLFVDGIEGSYHNVVGLPLTTVDECLAELGFALRTWSRIR